jgi:ABC-type lipoprotein release transport system permease subunit
MSRLSRFRYLHFRGLLVLTLILALASTLFSITAVSFLGFYNGFNAYLGEDAGVVAVYDVGSRTPFSGFVPAYLTENLSRIDGVLACSPEVITPCIVRNQTLFIRGIVPEDFSKINPPVMVEGVFLNASSLGSVVLGKNAADRLNIKVNDTVLVLATLADRYLELKVTGIYLSHSSMDDEALVQLNVGQWLRFSDYNRVTLIRVKINPDITRSNVVYQELARNASSTPSSQSISKPSNQQTPHQAIIPWSNINFPISKIGVTSTENVMKSFLDQYGITKEALVVLSIMIFVFSSVTIAVACQTLMQQHKSDFETLCSLGVSRCLLRFDVLCKVLPVSFAASALGTALAAVILSVLGSFGFLSVLSHGVVFSVDPLVVALNFVLMLGLVVFSVVRWGLD